MSLRINKKVPLITTASLEQLFWAQENTKKRRFCQVPAESYLISAKKNALSSQYFHIRP
jgi:hypothetical protein